MSDSLWPHGLQHNRPPCPTPGAYTNSCPSHWWCHPTISSSVFHFSSYLHPFPASGSFPRNWFFISGGQTIGVSVLASVLPMNIQDWFPLGLTGLISLQSRGLSRVSSWEFSSFKSLLQHYSSEASISWLVLSLPYGAALASARDYEKNRKLCLYGSLSAKGCLPFHVLSRFAMAFQVAQW